MGTMILAATSTTSRSNPAYTFIILAVLVGLFYLLIMRPQRNRQRRAMQTQNQVVPGQRVRTTAGMYGTVVSGDDRDVVVEISPGVQVTMLRRAIMEVVPDDAGPSPDASAPDYQTGFQTQDGFEHQNGHAHEDAAGHEEDSSDGSTSSDEWDLKDRGI
jgi:preprotein translocase subunit YajC